MNQIQRYELHETSYITLLEKALYANMITKQTYLERRKQIEQKLCSLVYKYHRGRSSSISITLYQRFLKSVLFTLDHAVSESEQRSVLSLTIEEVYTIGYAKIERIVDEIETRYLYLKQRIWAFLNERYHSIFDQIVSFLASYDTTFFAYRCIEDLDYPLLDGIPLQHQMYHKKGCDLVYEYIQRLTMEHTFLQRFHEEIPQLIHAYERSKGVTVAFLGCSLCEIVFHQYLFHLMTTQKTLLFDQNQHMCLCEQIYQMNLEKIWGIMQEKMRQDISKEEFFYLYKGKDIFLTQLKIAKDAHEVEHFILCESEDHLTQFKLAAPCDPQIYQTLLTNLETQMTAQEKAKQILQTDLRFYDYIDLFEADILQEEDYEELFILMHDVQLMSLFAYLAQDIMSFHQHITLSKKQVEALPCDSAWHYIFYAYIVSLSPTQKQSIIDMLERVSISFS